MASRQSTPRSTVLRRPLSCVSDCSFATPFSPHLVKRYCFLLSFLLQPIGNALSVCFFQSNEDVLRRSIVPFSNNVFTNAFFFAPLGSSFSVFCFPLFLSWLPCGNHLSGAFPTPVLLILFPLPFFTSLFITHSVTFHRSLTFKTKCTLAPPPTRAMTSALSVVWPANKGACDPPSVLQSHWFLAQRLVLG